MIITEWIRFILGILFLLGGLFFFIMEMVGVYRFKYALNRMHAAAMGDTLGIGFSIIGLILMEGFTFTSLKLFCIVLFLWFTSPVSSHMLASFAITVDEHATDHYDSYVLKELEEELSSANASSPQEVSNETLYEDHWSQLMNEKSEQEGKEETHGNL